MALFEPLTLTGSLVKLQPLRVRHLAELQDAVRDGELWKLWCTRIPSPRQSRDAIERLGARQDGVLRRHTKMPDGRIRDTVVYSVLDSEWPEVKARLRNRVTKERTP
ncbi:MAG: hypothetical protein ACQEXN_02155 [Actinomycetota bacterium]